MPRIHERGSAQEPALFRAQQASSWPTLPELPSLPSFAGPLATLSHTGLPDALRWAGSIFWSGGGNSPAAPTQRTREATGLGQASRLRSALSSYNALSPDWKAAVLGMISSSGMLAAPVLSLLSPTGPGGCDHNTLERCANCATSMPYVLVGVHAMKTRKTAAGKLWGGSMCAVGMASTTFHASKGKWRTFGRRMDYWSIAMASNLLTRSVYPNLPVGVTVAGMLLTPFKPFLVSAVNSTAMEYRFLQNAQKRPELRNAQRLHASTCLVGLGAFVLEEFFPTLPLVHAAWHCLSSVSVATVNNLLDDVERHHPNYFVPRTDLLTATSTPLLLEA